MILETAAVLAIIAAAGYTYGWYNKSGLAKADAAALKIETVVSTETKKIEAGISSEVAAATAALKHAQTRVTALLNSGHVAGTTTETTLLSTEQHLVNAAAAVVGQPTVVSVPVAA